MLKNTIAKVYRFFSSQRTSKYVVTMIICAVTLLVVRIFDDRILSDVLGIFLGFVISNLLFGFFQVVFRSFEDNAKVTDDTKMLVELYRKDDLEKKIFMNGTSAAVAYKPVYSHKGKKLTVIDSPDNKFQLDGFTENNFDALFGAHRASAKINFETVRVDDFKEEDGEAKFYIGRSTYYNHLVTNRAVDYRLDDDLSLRTYYEYGPTLKSFADSKMSNHIGINALVYLRDGELILPRRKGNSTISKNLVTSGIAVMLLLPEDNSITADYLFEDNILENLILRAKMKKEWIKRDEIDVKFLGCGQNPYEGGKPQFYYSVHMKNITRQDYITHLLKDNVVSQSELDVNKQMYVAKTQEMSFDKNEYLVVPYYEGRIKNGKYVEKEKKCVVGYEKSFLANLWHTGEYNAEPTCTPQDEETQHFVKT